MDRELVWRRLPDAEGWARNPHRHPRAQIEALSRAIRRFGFTQLPVLAACDEHPDGFVSSGNGRFEALRLLRTTEPSAPPRGIRLADDGEWLIPMWRIVFASRGEAEAQGLSDNWIAHMDGVEDDPEALAALLASLSDEDVGLAGIGLSDEDLDALLCPLPTDVLGQDDDRPGRDDRAGATPWSRIAGGDPNDRPCLLGDVEFFASKSMIARLVEEADRRADIEGKSRREVVRAIFEAMVEDVCGQQ